MKSCSYFQISVTPLPFCNDNELIQFDGVDLFCSPIRMHHESTPSIFSHPGETDQSVLNRGVTSLRGYHLCNGTFWGGCIANFSPFTLLSLADRECRCPGPVESTAVTPGPQPILPPTGCTVFEPPEGGAFVCVSVEGLQIYCSVMCDDKSEFSTFPLNPYTCGAITNFKWVDSTNRTRNILPECSGKS